METLPPVLALVRDLLFVSRITTAGRSVGRQVVTIRVPPELSTYTGPLLLVDLNLDGALEAAGDWKKRQGGQVIGFVSHTDAAMISRAREAGIDRVMARSAFVESLGALLSPQVTPPASPASTSPGQSEPLR